MNSLGLNLSTRGTSQSSMSGSPTSSSIASRSRGRRARPSRTSSISELISVSRRPLVLRSDCRSVAPAKTRSPRPGFRVSCASQGRILGCPGLPRAGPRGFAGQDNGLPPALGHPDAGVLFFLGRHRRKGMSADHTSRGPATFVLCRMLRASVPTPEQAGTQARCPQIIQSGPPLPVHLQIGPCFKTPI